MRSWLKILSFKVVSYKWNIFVYGVCIFFNNKNNDDKIIIIKNGEKVSEF